MKTMYEIEVLKYTNRISSMAHKEVGSCDLVFYVSDFHAFPGNVCCHTRNEGI